MLGVQKLDIASIGNPGKGIIDRDTPVSSASTRRSLCAKYLDPQTDDVLEACGPGHSDEVLYRLNAMSSYFVEHQQKMCKKQTEALLSLLMLKFSDSPAAHRTRQDIERIFQLGIAEAERMRLCAEDEVLRCSSQIAELKRTVESMVQPSTLLAAQDQSAVLSQRNAALTEQVCELQNTAAAHSRRISELQKENEGLQERLRELSSQNGALDAQVPPMFLYNHRKF